MLKKFFLLLILMLPVGVALAGSGGELSPGVPIQGEITERDEQDVYTYAGQANESVTITATALEGSSLDTVLELYTPDGELIGLNDDSESNLGTTDSELQATLPVNGEYRIIVQGFGGATTGAYEILLISGESGTPADNGGTVTPPPPNNALVFGETTTGDITPDQPIEYSFTGTGGDFVQVVVYSEVDTFVEIYDPSGELIASDDDSGPAVNPLIRAARLSVDGEYQLVLQTFFDDASGSYEITLNAIEAGTPAELVYGEAQDAELSQGQAITFTFESAGSEIISATVNGSFDAYLELYDPLGRMIASDDDSGGNGQPALYEVSLSESGTYMLAVTGYDLTQGGDFSVLVETVTGTASTTGEPIAYGDSINGNLSGMGRGRYLFNGTAGDIISIRVISDFDAYLELYDPGGDLLTSDDDSGGGLNPLIQNFTLPEDGEYRLEVSSFGGSVGGSYTVTLEVGEAVVEQDSEARPIAIGDTINDQLEPGQTARFRFTASAGDVISIDVEADFDGYLELLDPQGTIIATDDDSGEGLNPQLSNIALNEDGDYILSLGSFGGTEGGIFTLTLELGDSIVEPPSDQARVITFAERVNDNLAEGSTKRYVFNASTGDVVSVSASPVDLLEQDLDLYLELYQPNGALLIADDDSGLLLNPALVGIELPEDGTYRIEVSSFDNLGGGDFVLVLDAGTVYFSPAGDPAQALVFENEVATLTTSGGDLYQFETVAGQTLSMNTANPPDGFLALYSADGTVEDILSTDSPHTIPTDGTYLLYAVSSGDFELSLTSPVVVPEITVVAGDEVAVDVPVRGSVDANQVQTWTFKPVLDGVYTFLLNSADPAERYDPYLVLKDAAGNVLGQDDDSGGNFNALIEGVSLTGGTAVTLEVGSFAGQIGGDFVLAVVSESVVEPPLIEGGELAIGQAASNTLAMPSQQAQFSWNVPADGVFTLTLDGLKLPYIDVYAQDGELVGRGVARIDRLKLAAGSYRVVVYDRLNRTGDFTLTVETAE
jgi:hypothetical protein